MRLNQSSVVSEIVQRKEFLMRPQAILLGTILIVPVAASAQTIVRPQAPAPAAPAPARDNQQQPEKTGTARLSGRVTAGDTGKPLRRALVQAMSPDNPQGRSISTDGDGRWELKSLPAASYRIRVQKAGMSQSSTGSCVPSRKARSWMLPTDRSSRNSMSACRGLA